MMNRLNPSTDNPEYVEVAVPVPLDRTFTYRVPEPIREQNPLHSGKRVRVPFSGRILTGFVVSAAGPPLDRKVLDVVSVLDDDLIVTEEILQLTRWMADYYCVGWGEALKASLPGGGGGRSLKSRNLERVCTLGTLPRQEEVEKVLSRSPKQRELLSMVLETVGQRNGSGTDGEGINITRLPANLRAGPLKALIGRGWLQIQETEADTLAAPEFQQETGGQAHSPHILTSHQEAALKAVVAGLNEGGFHAFLLKGVTGSGKTEIYLRAIERALTMGRGVIVLVPEISLTPQVLHRFRSRFGERVAELHSGLTGAERYRQWRRVGDGSSPIVVGARSAVFAPVSRLGLIVVDEEHDGSYKQEESPRYNARDLALVRAQRAGACALLGSATPSLESDFNGETGKYSCLTLPKRVEDRPLPHVSIVDLRKRSRQGSGLQKGGSRGILSGELVKGLLQRIERREQSLLFLNRRGFASCLQCRDCGWAANCPHCDVSLTYHVPDRSLRCHYCDHRSRPSSVCPTCAGPNLDTKGVGTQRVEDAVQEMFPDARVVRMDRDTTRSRGAHERILKAVSSREVDILIGTQMVAKGHDYPGITLVGVILADATINMPDFRSAERTFQILTQVSGRAGRGETPGEVIIQTYRPDHYAVRYAATHDYEGFVQEELFFRKELGYPPYARMTRFRVEGQSSAAAEQFAGKLAERLGQWVSREGRKGDKKEGVEILGPAPGVFGKLQGRFRWQVVLKGESAKDLSRIVRNTCLATGGDLRPPSGVRFGVDVDPIDLY
jgi:primosomal protein N' (replication factor Y)